MYDKDENKEVNLETENVYYNYEEPVKEKKKGFLKRIFRGKKKVTRSEDIGVDEANFYGDDYAKDIKKEDKKRAKEEVKQEVRQEVQPEVTHDTFIEKPQEVKDETSQVRNEVPEERIEFSREAKKEVPAVPLKAPELPRDYGAIGKKQQKVIPDNPPKEVNSPSYQFGNSNPNKAFNNDSEAINYYYPEPKKEVIVEEEPLIPKKTGYTVLGVLVMVAIVILVFNLISNATKKYTITVGYSSITLKVGEGYQIPFMTNDRKNTTFKIADETVATINSNGYVQPKSISSNIDYSKTTIKIGSDKARTYEEITLYVVPNKTYIPLEDFTVPSQLTVKKGERVLINISNITPENNTQSLKYSFTSKDTGIATVDGSGFIQGNKKGITTIIVKNNSNSELNKEIKVTVK